MIRTGPASPTPPWANHTMWFMDPRLLGSPPPAYPGWSGPGGPTGRPARSHGQVLNTVFIVPDTVSNALSPLALASSSTPATFALALLVGISRAASSCARGI